MEEQRIDNRLNISTHLLTKRMLISGAVGLLIVGVFVIGAGSGKSEWGNLWQIKPLVMTPILSAIVGIFYHLAEPLRKRQGWLGTVFITLSIIAAVIGIWISLVLGLNGTMWN